MNRTLYKANIRDKSAAALKTEKISRLKRDRTEKRQALHLTGRNISIDEQNVEETPNQTEQFKVSNKETYLSRFLEWKKQKQAKLEEGKKIKKKPPFYCLVSKSKSVMNGLSSSTLPAEKLSANEKGGHHSHCVPRDVYPTRNRRIRSSENKENARSTRSKVDASNKNAVQNRKKLQNDQKNVPRFTPRLKTKKFGLENPFAPKVTSTRRKSIPKFVEEDIAAQVSPIETVLKVNLPEKHEMKAVEFIEVINSERKEVKLENEVLQEEERTINNDKLLIKIRRSIKADLSSPTLTANDEKSVKTAEDAPVALGCRRSSYAEPEQTLNKGEADIIKAETNVSNRTRTRRSFNKEEFSASNKTEGQKIEIMQKEEPSNEPTIDHNLQNSIPKIMKSKEPIEKTPQKPTDTLSDCAQNSLKTSSKVDLNVTPVNQEIDSPSNYLSPYVTTSRGRYSTMKEKLKRDSIYTLESTSPNEPVEARRKRESVKYFRRLLQEETDRLHAMCDHWEKMVENGIHENAIDLINVATGQTKLLTSKKFKQFSGLIDNCEMSIGQTKPQAMQIMPEDLEGFWCMLKLQIENIEKRFENLEKWKANNWNDPYEIVLKPRRKIKPKSPKAAAKGGSSMMNLIRKAQLAYMKQNGKQKAEMDDDVILTPSKRRNQIVENNSNCADPKEGRRSAGRRQSFMNSPKTPRASMHKKLSHINNSPRTPAINDRKSILKTPGTRSRNKSVIFNEVVNYKSPEKRMSTRRSSTASNEDADIRRLSLRTRSIVLSVD